MKNYITILAIAITVLATTSCVEQSDKYQSLLAQRDHLLIVEQNYNQALDVINEVDAGFQSIKEIETGIAVQFDAIEGKSLNKKEQFAMQISQIKEILEQNKSKIASLQGQLAQSNKRNKSLSITLERMNI